MKKVLYILLIAIILILLTTLRSYSEPLEKKVVVFLVNKMDLEDIESMPFTYKLADNGAIGLMNTRTYGTSNDYSASLTIGCGTRSQASFSTSRSEKLNKVNSLIYQRRTGYATESQEIANLDMARLEETNRKNNYNPNTGALGNSLGMNNIKVSVIGNSDIPDKPTRLGVLIGMDEKGLVDYGLVDEGINIEDANYPYGIKTNYDLMIESYKELSPKSGVIILELGDLHRLERYKSNLSSEMYIKLKEMIISDIDLTIKNVYNLVDEKNTRVIILSPTTSSLAVSSGKKLAPVILAGRDIDDGVISSDTTRREGIIANIDIAPYIAAYFNSNINFFTGKPMEVLHREDKLTFINEVYNDTAFIYKNRLDILGSFAIYEIIVSLFTFVVIQASWKYKMKFHRCIEYFLLSNMAIPIAILVLPLFKAISIYEAIIKIVVLTALITFISIYIRRETLDSIIFLSGLMCILLSIDIILGFGLIKTSFLGYDPIIGARYYGIGNEYMGMMVGTSLVFTTALLDRYRIHKVFIFLIFMVITIVIGFPKFGANVGGTITAVFAFMFVTLRLYNSKLKFKHYMYMLSSVFLFVLLVALVDLYLIESSSHLANAIRQINNGGMDVIYSIIKRKVSMNLKLFGITIWSKVLVTSLILLSILFYRPFGIAKRIFNTYSNLSVGLLGILISCIVSFVVNDSGVVASATSIIFLAMSLMYLVFREINSYR
ncbi:hypothetical protein R9X47_03410 [Wukongibacter baidiensis]|uniref:hypothetical protein n=1 Tax=Wukongibacter baidiensis TaxID=1723361 RepID=UPI003D7F8223